MSRTIPIQVPDIGDFKDIEIIDIHIAAGAAVNPEDPIGTLESDKAAMDIPAPAAGIVESVSVQIGDTVSQGDLLGHLTLTADAQTPDAATAATAATASATPPANPEPAADAPPPPKPADDAAKAPPPNLPPPTHRSGASLPHASPAIRRLARQLGADLTQISGTGAKGRILEKDLHAWIKNRLTQPAPGAAGNGLALPTIPAIDFSKFGAIEHQPLSRIRKLAGKHLHACWLNIPHVTQHHQADITDLERFRQTHKDAAKQQGHNLTLLVFVMKAVTKALQTFPRFNASLDSSGEHLIIKKYYHLGIAVDTPDGLVVPVVRDVDQKGFMALAAELSALSAKARAGKLTPGDLQGASFSISSLGGIGGTHFTPIINAPEVAILGLSQAARQPVWNGDAFAPRLLLPYSLSYDHRVIDGADGARFTTHLAGLLADIRLLMM